VLSFSDVVRALITPQGNFETASLEVHVADLDRAIRGPMDECGPGPRLKMRSLTPRRDSTASTRPDRARRNCSFRASARRHRRARFHRDHRH